MRQHKLRKLIAGLSDKEGRSREFISLYIPSNASIDEIAAHIKKESDCAVDKSGRTNERLQAATKNVIQHLKQHSNLPDYGLAIFAGTFVGHDSPNEILNVAELTPPQPITKYQCAVDDHFWVEPLREMLRDQRVVGIIVVDAKEASFGILNGERFDVLENITSGVPGKTGKGGQSQRRYEREREMDVTAFFHRVAAHATKSFLQENKVTTLLIGGPGHTKQEFLQGDFLHYELMNMLLGVVDTQSAGKDALKEVLGKSQEVMMNACLPEEKKMMQRLMTELNKQTGLAVCGLDPVLDGLSSGEVEVALVTDSTSLIETVATCKKCGLSKSKILDKKNFQAIQAFVSTPCENCQAVEYELVEKDMIDMLEDQASQTDARVEVFSTESPEKTQLAALGGFAAILRYKP